VADFCEYGKNINVGKFLDQLNDFEVKLCLLIVAHCGLKLNRNVILLLGLKVRHHPNHLPREPGMDEADALIFGSLCCEIRLGLVKY
jgi:hypothetical protein